MTRRTPALLATLAAGALALPLAAGAQSSVTIYGLMDASMRHATNVGADGASRKTMDDGIMTGTRLGFRGREDLGNRWFAQFTAEMGIDLGTGTTLQGNAAADYGQIAAPQRAYGREIHVGLRGPVGGITVGRNYTVAHALAGRFQPQGNPNSTPHSLFSSHHIARQDNMLRADARFGSVELHASHTLGEQSNGGSDAWALGAGYNAKDWTVAGYVQEMKNLADTETRRIWGLGGNVKLNAKVALFGGLMQRSSAVSPQENRAFTLGTNIELGSAQTLSLAVYDDQQSGSAALDGSRRVAWAVLTHRFSRRSDIYAAIDRNEVEGGYARPAFMGRLGTQNGVAVGLRHRF